MAVSPTENITDEQKRERVDLMRSIQWETWKAFKYRFDKSLHGEDDFWDIIPKDYKLGDRYEGDCEEFALICRKLLRDNGIMNSRLVFCTYPENGNGRPIGHVICEVDGYCFDNNEKRLKTKEQLERIGYKWVGISGYNPGDQWYRVLGADE